MYRSLTSKTRYYMTLCHNVCTKARSDVAIYTNTLWWVSYCLQVIVLWTANTERFCDVRIGLNDTANNLLDSIKRNEEEISPSTLFAVASILEEVRNFVDIEISKSLLNVILSSDWLVTELLLIKYY